MFQHLLSSQAVKVNHSGEQVWSDRPFSPSAGVTVVSFESLGGGSALGDGLEA